MQRANENDDRLLVAFGLTGDYPDANQRHFQFLLEGLQQVESDLKRRSIKFVVQIGDPAEVALRLSKRATELICDRGYLKHQVAWRRQVSQDAPCRVTQVEADAIVPVEQASEKREYAARTIRSKLNDVADEYRDDLSAIPLKLDSRRLSVDGIDLSNVDSILRELDVDDSVGAASGFRGGTDQAKRRLKKFLSDSLNQYRDQPDPCNESVSELSPYLHFGQVSPVWIAHEADSKRGVRREAKEAFLEELLVRRELAINFVHYERQYDSLQSLPDWAAETLSKHESDDREHRYTSNEMEQAETHDPVWNAAMIEMKHRGYLHNHLRMYWGKKIIEWTNTTQHAYRTALTLNNRYFLDGRDANSYANVLWLFGLHDRAHQEREVFGKVRYMSFDGLRRKFDVEKYVRAIAERYDVQIHASDEILGGN